MKFKEDKIGEIRYKQWRDERGKLESQIWCSEDGKGFGLNYELWTKNNDVCLFSVKDGFLCKRIIIVGKCKEIN